MEKLDLSGSSVDLLLADNKLVTEMAYWEGVFIKSLFYSMDGRFCGISTDREIDVYDESSIPAVVYTEPSPRRPSSMRRCRTRCTSSAPAPSLNDSYYSLPPDALSFQDLASL